MIAAAYDPVGLAMAAAVLGLLIGSFLNVVIHRLPKMLEHAWVMQAAEIRGEPAPEMTRINLATPRSRCPHCGHEISALENIPVLSYMVLRGRCRSCLTPISARYPAVEVLTGALSAYALWHFGFTLAGAGALLFIWALIVLAFIDLDTQLLPDNITLPLLWAGLLFNTVATLVPLQDAVIGAAVGYLLLWSVFWLFNLATGKEGMAYGDFKLLAAIGAWLGWQQVPLTLMIASALGTIVGIYLMAVAKHDRDKQIPFGPYLAVGGLVALFWGTPLVEAYLSLLGR